MIPSPSATREWWQTIYDEHYLDVYGQVLTPEKSAQEVDFVVRALGLHKKARVLDLACGFGRHTNELAARGYTVTGIDLSPDMLALARADAQRREVAVTYQQGDMRQPLTGRFDVVLLIASSFGYFGEADDQKVLRNSWQALGSKGQLLIDGLNFPHEREEFMRDGTQIRPHVFELKNFFQVGEFGVQQTSTLDVDTHMNRTRIAWKRKSQSRTMEFAITLYTAEQLTQMLAAAGFIVEDLWGDYDQMSYNEASPRLITRARKKG